MKEQMSKTERRKRFNDWYDRSFAEQQFRHGIISKLSFFNKGGHVLTPVEEITTTKIMSNADRKKAGVEIDEALEPVPCDRCGKETVQLKMLPMDHGKGLEFFYHCFDCLLGKNANNK